MSLPLTKSEAQAIAQTYVTSVAARVYKYLRDRAKSGFVGGVFTYTAQDNTNELLAVRNKLRDAGWTVVVDTNEMTATIS